MKKRILIIFLMSVILTLVSCDFNKVFNFNKQSNTKTSTTTITEYDLSSMFNSLKSLTYATINETTTAKKNNNTYVAKRTTNVDLNNNYYYASISGSLNSGTMQNKDNSFYYMLKNDTYNITYSDTSDIFKTTGISDLLDINISYNKNESGYYKTITDNVSRFDTLFKNINYDFAAEYVYNPSYLKVSLEVGDNSISKIKIDASLAFGSYYSSVIREITIEVREFDEVPFDLSTNDKYYVNTSDTLDTYVIEMCYQYGDSIYIKSGDFDMLIDAGYSDDGKNVDKILREYCSDHKLDLLIATHGHQDHIGGFGDGAIDSINDIGVIIDYGYVSGGIDAGYEKYRTYFDDTNYFSADDCINLRNGAMKIFKFSDDLAVEVLNTGAYQKTGSELHSDCTDENEHSVVVKLTFKEHTYLYTGDVSGSYESYLKEEDIKDVTVYKAAHHGSSTHSSNSASFLNYVNPEISVVSAAIVHPETLTEQYHPSKAFVNRILNTSKIKLTKNLYYNGTMGTIHLSDDGKNEIKVTGFGATRGYYYNGSKVINEENLKFSDTKLYNLKY